MPDNRFGACHTVARVTQVTTSITFYACQRQYTNRNTSAPVSLTSQCSIGILPNIEKLASVLLRLEIRLTLTRIPTRIFAETSDTTCQTSLLQTLSNLHDSLWTLQTRATVVEWTLYLPEKAPFHGVRVTQANFAWNEGIHPIDLERPSSNWIGAFSNVVCVRCHS